MQTSKEGAYAMIKQKMKKRVLSLAVATAVATTTFSYNMPFNLMVQAQKGEDIPTATNKFDSNYDTQNAYTGNDLGCTYTKEKTTFKVWSPLATKVILCRYATGSDSESGQKSLGEVEMVKGDRGVWSATVDGDIVNTYYTYKVTANGKTNEAVDIYAKAVGVNGDRAMVVDLDSTNPSGWDTSYTREKTKLSDISVWEVHIRDFSIDVSSGVSEKNRGKYMAFTESTTLNNGGKIATCVDYLKELGVTHVQLMPMYDYASVDETKVTNTLGSNYNWGYDPENYNAPEGSYSSNPYDGNVRIKEMKQMIQALHDAGIKVIMDVVYNHTYDTLDSNFSKIMPDYYYRIGYENPDTKEVFPMRYSNGSGCGNTTRSESAMYGKFMKESLLYWAEEYNLDGFRFDLMGLHDIDTMNSIRKAMDDKFGESTIVMFGEGWRLDDSGNNDIMAHKGNIRKLNNIGIFNEQIRDSIKGEHKYNKTIGLVQQNYVSGGFVGGPGEQWPGNLCGGIIGSVGFTTGTWGLYRPYWSDSSDKVISYTSAHDNLTLWDKITEQISDNDKLIKMSKMAGGVILTSHGGVFMQAGEEFGRTKNGDENSYKSSDNVNKIDWSRVETYATIKDYYQGLLAIRQAFSGFRTTYKDSGTNGKPNDFNLEWISNDIQGNTINAVSYYLTNDVKGEWNRLAVLVNNQTSDRTFNLSKSNNWIIVANGSQINIEKGLGESGSEVKVPAKSVVIAVPKDTFDANPIQAKNNAPTIAGAADITVKADEKVEFTVTTKDADGDAVTLAAKDVPTAASFDAKTGKFTWDKAVAGEYTVTFTATDGKATTTKAIKITVEGVGETPSPSATPAPSTQPTETPSIIATPNPTQGPIATGTPNVTATATPEPNPTQGPIATGTPNVTATATPAPNTTKPPTNTLAPDITEKPTTTPVVTQKPSSYAEELEIKTFKVAPTTTQVIKKPVKLTVAAQGGEGYYTYQFLVINSKGSVVSSSKYITTNSYTWTPTKADTYTFQVSVKDSSGDRVQTKKQLIVIQKKLSALSLKVSKKTAKVGKTVKLTAKATGGKTKYTYSFVITNAKGKKVKTTKYTKKNYLSWKAKTIGKYTLKVIIKDATGAKATKTIKNYQVKK